MVNIFVIYIIYVTELHIIQLFFEKNVILTYMTKDVKKRFDVGEKYQVKN